MCDFLEEAEELFKKEKYAEAKKMLRESMSKISAEKEWQVFNLCGCCQYLMKEYQQADVNFNRAILSNPLSIDDRINKAAALISYGNISEGKEILQEAAKIVHEPTINFNLSRTTDNPEEKYEHTIAISQHEKINDQYDKYEGVIPFFLKQPKRRRNYALQLETQIIQKFKTQATENLKCNSLENWAKSLLQMISQRIQLQQANGYFFNSSKIQKISSFMQSMTELLDFLNCHEIEQDVISEQIQELFVVKDAIIYGQIDEELNQRFTRIMKQISKRGRYIHYFSRMEEFLKHVENLRGTLELINLSNYFEDKLKIIRNKEQVSCFISHQVQTSIEPSKTLEAIINISKEENKQFLLKFYWIFTFIIFLTEEEGSWSEKAIKYKLIFKHIFSESQSTKDLDFQSLYQILTQILTKIEKITQGLKSELEKIKKNICLFQMHFTNLDDCFSAVLNNSNLLQLLLASNISQKVPSQHKHFREHYNIHSSLVENTIAFVYQMKSVPQTPSERYAYFLHSAALLAQNGEELNGKEKLVKQVFPRKPFWRSLLEDDDQ